MATSSFAVGSVSVAIVWGTFFYPPPPERASSGVPAAAVAPVAIHAAPVVAPAAPMPVAVKVASSDAVPHLASPAVLTLSGPALVAKH